MMKPSFFFGVLTLTSAVTAQGATYTLTSGLSGQAFLDAFEWQAIPDPTNGDVNYVNQTMAEADGLYSITGSSVILRADDTTVLSGTGPGRNSFRLESLDQYTTHVAMQVSRCFDIAHMPEGCGTWPAVCEFLGEVDIVEGVNDQSPNQSTLHTSASKWSDSITCTSSSCPDCTLPTARTMTGMSLGTDCDVYDTNNSGCGVALADGNSFGPGFNSIGGGWYAIERSATYISIYFWERGSSTVPSQVSSPGSTVDTSTWGEPVAYFPSTDCDFSTHFGPHNIIINLTFCGDWAGNSAVYAASGCPSTCTGERHKVDTIFGRYPETHRDRLTNATDYVNANPMAFTGAYFEFNALNIYQ
ncbi:glycoside hydrolase family 16 protein [Lanmaoa asiatica]|nr:glycoside hydrolase family 16 protein [Lanmaoa asiatica]